MKFTVIELDVKEFYPTYRDWSKAHGFPCRVLEELDRVFVCFNGDEPIYSCFFWRTPSTFCVIGFPFSNPFVGYQERVGGMTYLFQEMMETIKAEGFRFAWTTSNTDRVESALLESGFVQADTNVHQYVKVLF